jgi:SRSO17 transposase
VPVLDTSVRPRVRRLLRYLEQFKGDFSHRLHNVSLRRYLQGILGDSPRKSMQAMLARVTDPGHYQALQHFITHATWDPQPVWRRVLELLPVRAGLLVIDDTSFPKQGRHSVGVARQYCGALGKIANCQVATTTLLWAKGRAWMLGAALYLPKEWTRDRARCERGYVPETLRFQEKWRLALTLLRRARAAGLTLTGVLADAAYGDVTVFREALHRLQLPYALGISSHLTVFRGTPRVAPPASATRRGRPPTRFELLDEVTPIAVSTLAATLPARAWRRVTWHHEHQVTRWTAEFAAVRITPAHGWQRGRLLPEIWLLAQRPVGRLKIAKYFFIHLPARTTLTRLVWLAHQRWAIEQQYQHLKDELGLDHFEGRSYPGWNRHVVLTAVAYTFLQQERRHTRGRPLTFPAARALVCEIFTALYFAANPKQIDYILQLRGMLPLRI